MILASKSPRRKEILENFGFVFKVEVPEIEEISSKKGIKEQIEDISRKKAVAIGKVFRNDYVVAADTVVVIGGEILGKPRDVDQAKNMLKTLSGKVHKVITAYSFYNLEKNIDLTRSIETEVKFRDLTDGIIEWYIASGEPMDKAGAYGIQGKGAVLVENINGDFFSVMGFPIGDFIENIQKNGIGLNEIKSL